MRKVGFIYLSPPYRNLGLVPHCQYSQHYQNLQDLKTKIQQKQYNEPFRDVICDMRRKARKSWGCCCFMLQITLRDNWTKTRITKHWIHSSIHTEINDILFQTILSMNSPEVKCQFPVSIKESRVLYYIRVSNFYFNFNINVLSPLTLLTIWSIKVETSFTPERTVAP